jgi:hypothetical protein
VQHLDAILAFAAVMLAASLVITAATQATISLLGLRGANLRRTLANLFESACQDRDAKRYSNVIARRVLHQPLVSGSVFSRTGLRLQELPFLPADAAGKLRWAGSGIPFQPWLLGALSGFFGWPMALWLMNRVVAWDFCTYAGFVAQYVPVLNLCEHPWRSGAILGAVVGGLLSRWRMATSIRLDELADVLEKLSAPAGGTLPDPAQRAMLVIAGETRSRLRPKTAPAPSLMDRIDRMMDDAGDELEGGVAVAVQKPITQVAAQPEARIEGLNFWFDRAMERASQRFTVQARVIVVVLSAVLVFGAHLDAVRLFQSLSSDAQLRAQWATSADAMTKLAEQFPRGKEAAGTQFAKDGGRAVVPEVYRAAMVAVLELPPAASEPSKAKPRRVPHNVAAPAADTSQLLSTSADAPENSGDGGQAEAAVAQAPSDLGARKKGNRGAGSAKSKPDPKEHEKSAAGPGEDRVTLGAKARASKALGMRPGFASREDALTWLRETLEGDPALDHLTAAYEQEVNAQLPSDADKLVDQSASIRRELARSRTQLIPETWHGWAPVGSELPGQLIAIVFLSLGATLCFNVLKKIASLRPLPTVK